MTSLKKSIAALVLSLPLVASAQGAAPAIKFKFSGDLNNRFMVFTDQAGMYSGSERIAGAAPALTPQAVVQKDTLEEAWGELKYRFTVEAATEDNAAKGVYGIELGAVRFGGANGGAYSGDGNNYETRFAYLDVGLGIGRLSLGLQPFLVNKYLWNETAAGVQLKGDAGVAKYTLAWMRGNEVFTSNTAQEVTADGDAYLLRADLTPMPDAKAGAFFLYQHRNTELSGTAAAPSYLLKRAQANVDYDLYNIGVDAAYKLGTIFLNADLIYQTGKFLAKGATAAGNVSVDTSGFFAHVDVGANLGAAKVTYTGWYSSGTSDTDTESKSFIATDVDINESIVLQEGGYTDDVYFTEAPYFLTYGAIFNKVAIDFKASPQLTVGGALLYIMTAEDIVLGDGSKANVMGTEFDAYASYKLNPNTELAVNAGYLLAGDAMDAWEAGTIAGNGKADSDIFRMTARVRYIF